jgi:hypothetical protein
MRSPDESRPGMTATPSVPPASWWEMHDRAKRDAAALLGLASTICAAYLAAVVVIVLAILRVGKWGPWHGIETLRHRVGPLGVVVIAIGFVAIAGAIIVCVSRLAIGAHIVRRARARAPSEQEAARTHHMISDIALGLGCTEPRLSIVDDPAVNALATGRPRDPRVVLTSGALALGDDELETLCAHTAVAVSQPAVLLAGAAAAMLLDADWCTRLIWGVAGVVFLSGLAGVPTDVVALTFLGIVALVVVTKPLVVIAYRSMVRLLDCTAELTDLETVRVTNEPRRLAVLMLDVTQHRKPVTTAWDVAHLWFDPETRTSGSASWWGPTVRAIAGPDSPRTRSALVDRARVLVGLAGPDDDLRERLARAGRAIAGDGRPGSH